MIEKQSSMAKIFYPERQGRTRKPSYYGKAVHQVRLGRLECRQVCQLPSETTTLSAGSWFVSETRRFAISERSRDTGLRINLVAT